MNEVISKVKQVAIVGDYKSPHGIYKRHYYEFEDGSKMVANHKSELPFKPGSEVGYTVRGDDTRYSKYGKVNNPGFVGDHNSNKSFQKNDSKWEDREKGIKIGHAINNAVAISLGLGTSEQVLEKDVTKYAKIILKISEELNNPTTKEVKPEPTIEHQTNDLPF